MKKTLALLLVACLALTMIPFMAFAASAADLNVNFLDESGQPVERLHAGDSLWAVFSIANYADFVGEATYEWDGSDDATADSVFDRSIAVATAYLTLDPAAFSVATDTSGNAVWSTPYADIAECAGGLSYNQDGDNLKLLLETDNRAGANYSISKSELDANYGVLFAVKLAVSATAADGDYNFSLYEGDGTTAASIATVSRAVGETSVTVGTVPLTGFGAVTTIALGDEASSGDISLPEVVEPEYTLVDQLDGFTFADWTATNTSATCTAGTGDVGSFGINASAWGGGSTLTGNEEFFLGNGDFAFSAKVYVGTGSNNTVPGFGALSFDKMYYSVAVGDLEFRLIACNTPAILYNGSVIAVGESVITPMYEMDGNGGFVLVDGSPVATTNEDGTAVYADKNKYRSALINAKLHGSDVILTLAVEGTDVVGKATIGGTETELVRVAKPAGALSATASTSVKMYGMNGWTTNYMKGAKLVSDKFITPIDPIINNPLFTTDNWTLVSGNTNHSEAANNVVFAADGSYVRTGIYSSDVIITYANKTFTGNDFTLTYKVKRRTSMGNDNSGSEHFGMRVGDLYFCLNQGGLYPYVEYAGEAVYQSELPIYTLVGISESGAADIESKAVKEKCNIWASSYEGNNPTYTISFSSGKLTVKYSSSNFAETVLVDTDISAYVTSFTDAAVSINNNTNGGWGGYDQYSYVKMIGSTEPIDVGYLNALVGTYADYADYSQYPECFTELKAVYKNLSANKQALVTNYSIIENYDNEYKAYTELGTVDYREYLIQNFKSSEWTKVSGSDVTFGKLGDISDVISYKNGTGVYTAGPYNLGNEFHLNFTEFHAYYNTNTDTYLGFYVGDLFFKVDLSVESGDKNTNAIISVYNGSELVASSDSIGLAQGNGTSAVSTEFAANYATVATDGGVYFGGRYSVDYVDGAVTVSVNGTEVLTAAVGAVDLTAAELKFDYKCSWKTMYVYNFNLSAASVTVNLYDLNKEIAALANVTDFSTYSSIAKTVDAVIDQISEDKLAAMYNLGIYENYKLNYSLCQNNYTYNLVKGLYTSDWKSSTVSNYVRDDTYPTGAIKFPNVNTSYKVVLANKLYTSNYFKVSAKHAYYARDTYVEYSVGELKIRLMNDTSNASSAVVTETPGNLTLNVYMNDTLIYSAVTKPQTDGCTYTTLPGSHGENGWYYSLTWTFIYNNGLLTPVYNNGDCSLTAIDLTACEGWDSSYTPNGKEVTFSAFQNWGAGVVTGLSVIGKVNADAITAIDALAAEDVAAAKNIYDTLSDGASNYLSAATNAALKDDFTYTAENATVASDLAQYRYGDTVTLTATADEGYDFTGWYDADGNLLTADAAYSVKVMPGVSVTAKAEEPVITTIDGDWNADGSITWSINTATGELTISGTGDMAAYGIGKSPVLQYADIVKSVVIGDGITSIGSRAFRDMVNIESVTFGADVATTGYEVFYNCTSLTSVTLNEGLTEIGSLAFSNTAIAEITLPSTLVKLNNRVFKNCASLTYISVPDSVTYVGYEEFMNCTSLTGFKWTAGYNYINGVTFSGCTSLVDVKIPATVYHINSNAFANCTSLATVDFEDSDTLVRTSPSSPDIASNAFDGCNSTLVMKAWSYSPVQNICTDKGFVFEAKNSTIFKYTVNEDGTSCAVTGVRGTSASAAVPTEIDGYTVTAIGAAAFRNKTNITNITIPETVTSIGSRAFQNTGIRYITIPDSVTTLGHSAFMDCASLETVILGSGIQTIDTNTFANCTSFTTLSNYDSVTSIGATAFSGCTSLTILRLKENVATIKATAFDGCSNLTIECTEGSKAQAVAVSKGINYRILTDFNYSDNEDGTITITEYLGNGGDVVIPSEINGKTVTGIDKRVFKNNTAVTSITIPETVTSISYEVFNGAANLTDVYILNAEAVINRSALTGAPSTMVIHGYEGSTAQTIAEKNSFTFEAIVVEA